MTMTYCPHCGCNLDGFDPVEYGNVCIDGASEILFRGRAVPLARTQHIIVEALIRARGRYLTRGLLANMLGGDIYDQAISQYIRRSRSAFLAIDPSFDQIECHRGFGAYRWRYRKDSDATPDAYRMRFPIPDVPVMFEMALSNP